MFSADFFKTGCADARLLHQLGITRVGDITGLDVIGLPVWFASRPNSRALSVSQGKGMTQAQARIAAVMEAAEGAIAERAEDVVERFASLAEIRQQGHQSLPLDRMMRCAAPDLDPTREFAWVRGYGLKSATEILAPYELIGLDMRAKAPWDHQTFKMSSIGLAAGGNAEHALTHGLLEVVEHDATSTLDLLGLGGNVARAIRPDTDIHPDLDQAIARITAAGFTPHFFDISGRVALPVIACFMTRTVMSDTAIGAKLSAGFACRADAYDAALAALLECVQSRATDIAGSRDDITAADYRESLTQLPKIAGDIPPLASVSAHRAAATFASTADMSAHVVNAVIASGAEDIFAFPLVSPVAGLHVTRVLVPGLNVGGTEGVTRAGAGLIDALLRGM